MRFEWCGRCRVVYQTAEGGERGRLLHDITIAVDMKTFLPDTEIMSLNVLNV